MKYYLLAVLLAFSTRLYSQVIFLRLFSASGKNGVDFVQIDHDKRTAKKLHCDYTVLKNANIDFMTYWGVGNGNIIYWTNGENLYKLNAANGSSKLVASKLSYVLELAVRGNYAYVAYNPTNANADLNGRHAPGVKLVRINLTSGDRKDIYLSPNTTITNLSVSRNGQRLSFIDTKNFSKGMQQTEYLKVYDLKSETAKTIDSARAGKREWFINADRLNTAAWGQSDQYLIYYKSEKQNSNGSMFAYDLQARKRRKLLENVPQMDFLWFGYSQFTYYFSNRNKLYSTKDGKAKKTFYTLTSDNILEAIVL